MSPGKGEVVEALSNGKQLIPDIAHGLPFARPTRRLPADLQAGQYIEFLAWRATA
jgi:hypothetical protein